MANKRMDGNEQEESCEWCREKLKQVFDKITNKQVLRFFYKYVSGVVANTPCVFKKGE